jgi:hypothetical protein
MVYIQNIIMKYIGKTANQDIEKGEPMSFDKIN